MQMSQLYRLGRRLSDLALEGMGSGELGLTPSEFLVLQDLFMNGDSSISDTVTRTGLAQSRVSTSVAGFVDRGWVTTGADPHDGRRTIVHVTDNVRHLGEQRRAARSNDVLSEALHDIPATERRRLEAALHRLHELLVT